MADDAEQRSSGDDRFRQLMERVRAGCPEAAQELYDVYGEAIRRVVRRRLHQKLRAQYDSLDFLQDVWASFFLNAADKYPFGDAKSLINFLAGVAQAKVAGAFRRGFQTQKRNLNEQRQLQVELPDGEITPEPPSRGPTPSQVAVANEQWERLLAGQPASCRLALEMLRQGYSRAEISERTGLPQKLIQRMLQKLARRQDLP